MKNGVRSKGSVVISRRGCCLSYSIARSFLFVDLCFAIFGIFNKSLCVFWGSYRMDWMVICVKCRADCNGGRWLVNVSNVELCVCGVFAYDRERDVCGCVCVCALFNGRICRSAGRKYSSDCYRFVFFSLKLPINGYGSVLAFRLRAHFALP